jgi:hypothetical protein
MAAEAVVAAAMIGVRLRVIQASVSEPVVSVVFTTFFL